MPIFKQTFHDLKIESDDSIQYFTMSSFSMRSIYMINP